MAETVGVTKSSVSRQASKAAGEWLKELGERRLGDRDYLIVYVDGIQLGCYRGSARHHRLAALAVDERGEKRILGIRKGAMENAVVALALLEHLVERGLEPEGRGSSSSTGLGAALGCRPSLRRRLPRAALPQPQDAQRDRLPA